MRGPSYPPNDSKPPRRHPAQFALDGKLYTPYTRSYHRHDQRRSDPEAEQALIRTEEAIAAWIDAALDAGEDIPPPTSIDLLRKRHKDWRKWIWALVKVDPAVLDDTVERVNISLPRRVLRRLDALAHATGETRSGFIARMALESRQRVS